MPKKINMVFEDDVFEKLAELKGSQTYSKFVSDLVLQTANRNISDEENVKVDNNGSAEVLEVSSEKLLSILNAINERFALFVGYEERFENIERAVEGLTVVADSIERIVFDNKENFEELKNPIHAIQEEFGRMDTPHMVSAGTQKGITDSSASGSSPRSEEDFETFEFACPSCDGTVDENDYFCRWCAVQLADDEQANQSSGYYDNYGKQERAIPQAQYQRPVGSDVVQDAEWKYDITDRNDPPSGPPTGWNGSKVLLDPTGRPICPKCLEAMIFVEDYERWFCEVCWYYAPSDFLRGNRNGSLQPPTRKLVQKERQIVDTRKDNKRKWNSKKIGDLPLFKKKRDKR